MTGNILIPLQALSHHQEMGFLEQKMIKLGIGKELDLLHGNTFWGAFVYAFLLYRWRSNVMDNCSHPFFTMFMHMHLLAN